LDVTGDALAATWDQRVEALAGPEFDGDDDFIKPTIQ
jgi:hypothetical protein